MGKIRISLLAVTVFALSGLIMANMTMSASSDPNAPAKPGFARGRMGPGFFGAPLITIALNHKSELNLTTDQVTNLENIRSHYQSQVTPVQQQLSSVEKEIASLMQQTPANWCRSRASFRTPKSIEPTSAISASKHLKMAAQFSRISKRNN